MAPFKNFKICDTSAGQGFRKTLFCANISKFPLPFSESLNSEIHVHTHWVLLPLLRSQRPL